MAVPDRMDERLRALRLVEGQRMAQAVLAEVVEGGLIVPGSTECEVDDRIWDVAGRSSAPPWVGLTVLSARGRTPCFRTVRDHRTA